MLSIYVKTLNAFQLGSRIIGLWLIAPLNVQGGHKRDFLDLSGHERILGEQRC
jgi:hypothetical protein